ncbi:MAG: hypothetical protein HOQ21_09780 [Dermatophilaceae bacterium]|nr:hypothetical protein [Dermatophilaceae bacterium]
MTLDEFVNELALSDAETPEELGDGDRQRLERVFNAAVEFVERIHRGRFNFNGDPGSTAPAPGENLRLGTLMLARRWNTRRRSPDGLVAMGELGASRVSFGDPDVDRLLRLGRHAIPRVG